MDNVVDIEPYRLARVLINALHARAETHAETMVKRMARRNDGTAADQWRRIHAAIGKLRRQPPRVAAL